MLATSSIPASATPSPEAIQRFWAKYLDLLRRYGIAATAEPYIESVSRHSPPISFGEKGFLSLFPVGKGWRRPRGQDGFVRDFAAVNPPQSPLIRGETN